MSLTRKLNDFLRTKFFETKKIEISSRENPILLNIFDGVLLNDMRVLRVGHDQIFSFNWSAEFYDLF